MSGRGLEAAPAEGPRCAAGRAGNGGRGGGGGGTTWGGSMGPLPGSGRSLVIAASVMLCR